jgi:phosphoheptose isomerase
MNVREESWKVWSDAVAACVRGVPDVTLAHAAELLCSSTIVLTAGNGGSHALATHAAQALLKPSYAAGGGRQVVCLTDSISALSAHANDGGWAGALEELGRPFFDKAPRLGAQRAVLWLFSSSGKSENLVRLASLATSAGHRLIAFTGFDGEPLRSMATISVHVDSRDYEVVEPVHDALLHRVQYHIRTR